MHDFKDMYTSLLHSIEILFYLFFVFVNIVGIQFTLIKALVKSILYMVYMIKLEASKGMHQNLKIAFNPCMNPRSMHEILLPQVLLCLSESTHS